MAEPISFPHRRFPRFPLWRRVQVRTQDGGRCLPGSLCDLSQAGCRLRLTKTLAPGLSIEVHCDIQGRAFGLLRETVWSDGPGGGFRGFVITAFASEADARFHGQYLEHLAHAALSPNIAVDLMIHRPQRV